MRNSGIPQDSESTGSGISGILQKLQLSCPSLFLEILKFVGTEFSVVHRGQGIFSGVAHGAFRKILRNLDCLKTRSHLECSGPAFNKHRRNTKGANLVQLIMCPFSFFSMKFLQIVFLLNAGLEHSRSNLAFETLKNFIFRILYLFAFLLQSFDHKYVNV